MEELYNLPNRVGRLIGRRKVKYGMRDGIHDSFKDASKLVNFVNSIPKGCNAVFVEEGETVGGGTMWIKKCTLSFYRITPKERASLLRSKRKERDAELERYRANEEKYRPPYPEERRDPSSRHYDAEFAYRTSPEYVFKTILVFS